MAKSFFIRATHTKSKQQSLLEVEEGQIWFVGRSDGSELEDRWNIPFDSTLSRHHFLASVGEGVLEVTGTQNRRPLLFQGNATQQFVVPLGQVFTSAKTVFEFGKQGGQSRKPRSDQDDLLLFTLMLTTMIRAGIPYLVIFPLIGQHLGESMSSTLQAMESAVSEGEALSKAMQRFPQVFSEQYVAMIELGEKTSLARSLKRLRSHMLAEHLKTFVQNQQTSALAESCLSLGDMLDQGMDPLEAFDLAIRTCFDDEVGQVLLQIRTQLASGVLLVDCDFPPPFLPHFQGLLASHHQAGSTPLAFREIADLLGY